MSNRILKIITTLTNQPENSLYLPAFQAQKMKEKQPISSEILHTKTSFAPISHPDIKILILGSIPGDRSIELGEYYGHARNRFWKIISTLTGNDLLLTYEDKKDLLLNNNIGVWDVAHKAIRKGSLDTAIMNEEPNDLESFIANHPQLKVIGFNGTKAQAIYDKYFKRKNGIKYVLLPSSSPANARMNLEQICEQWRQLWID